MTIADAYNDQDQFESINRIMFNFNDQADKRLLKPVSKAYKFVTPKVVNEGITNFFGNLGDIGTFANSLFQGKFHNAVITLNRVIYNTTFGLAGIFDVASRFGLNNEKEDFGQTLAYWGYENSSYLVLPFLGPSTPRDLMGQMLDSSFQPLPYVEDIHRDTHLVLLGVKGLDKRADLLGAENLLVGMDRYQFIRSAYFQNREFLIKDGEIEDPFADEEFEDF